MNRKRERQEEETPASKTKEGQDARPWKSVRFHYSTIDNSLWADLNTSKYASERPPTPTPTPSPSSQDFPPPLENTHSLASDDTAVDACPTPTQSEVPLEVSSNAVGASIETTRDEAEDADESSSLDVQFEDDNVHDCDDDSVPRGSPSPELRIEVLKEAGLSERAQAQELLELQNRPTTREMPSIYMRPPLSYATPYGTSRRQRTISNHSGEMKEVVSRDVVNQSSRVLMAALSRLPDASARAARDALEQITRWQGQRGYEAGYKDGIKLAQTVAGNVTEDVAAKGEARNESPVLNL